MAKYKQIFRYPLTYLEMLDAKLPQNIRLFTCNSNILLSTDILKLYPQCASEAAYLADGKTQLCVLVHRHQDWSGTSPFIVLGWIALDEEQDLMSCGLVHMHAWVKSKTGHSGPALTVACTPVSMLNQGYITLLLLLMNINAQWMSYMSWS